MHDVAIKLIVLSALYVAYRIVKAEFMPMPSRPNSTLLRKLTRDRMRSTGTPRLCGRHTGAVLRPGQMAIVDSERCELCIKERRSA